MTDRGSQSAFPSDGSGITIREYFAAQAPKVPDFFVPKVSPCPPTGETIYQYVAKNRLSEYTAKYYSWEDDEWHDDKNEVPEKVKQNIKNVQEAFKLRKAEIEKWNMMYEMQKVVQWAYFYADQMILAGQKPVQE
jgi:hypothetical protein